MSALCSITVTGSLDGSAQEWQLPEEVPVAFQINSTPYAVMMATPADLEDFGIGFAISEGLVRHSSHVSNIISMPSGDGQMIDIAISDENIVRERKVSRTLEGRVGCGLCGIEDMADAVRMPVGRLNGRLDAVAVARAYETLHLHQPMNAVNRTVHAAAWCNSSGDILFSREDVGRHNALDKLIGAMARQHVQPTDGFVLMSSRCSFELVQKCALAGIGALATVSAPTALAHRLAKKSGLKLAALSQKGVMLFDGVQV
jgi:FdhD protein